MRQPGFEPGFEAWQASVITTTLPAQKSSMRSCERSYIKVINAMAELSRWFDEGELIVAAGPQLAEVTDTFEFELQHIYDGLNVENRRERIIVGNVDGRVVAVYLYARHALLI